MKSLFNILLKISIVFIPQVIGISPHPSHFRIVPLSFYTLDGRNDKFFSNPNKYGVRIAWIGSESPSNEIIINYNNNISKFTWQIKNKFNVHKNDWGNHLRPYSFIDLALNSGIQEIIISPWRYEINIPKFGQSDNNDATIFIGDANIKSASRWALGNADKVIKSKLLEYKNKIKTAIWVGDIFYNDNDDIITKEWPKLLVNNNNKITGVTNYLQLGLLGNHDYSSSSACHECNWVVNKYNLMCSNNDRVSGIWVQYFFATDALKSFHNGLSDNYHRSCRVPYEYTLQIIVIGRTGFIILDNAWGPYEVKIDWNNIKNKINIYIDNLFIVGHWDYKHSGANSNVNDWVEYLYKYFYDKKITGIQGHTHINKISYYDKYLHSINKQVKYKIVTAGGNGFRGSGCDCRNDCYNCHCCCPTIYNNNQWMIGGWNNGELCHHVY